MTRKTRRIIFFFAVIIFLILSYIILMFALGYRYDVVEGKFLKTGSLRLSVNASSEIYINDAYAGETSFFDRTFTKSLMLPRTYNVRIQKENYQTWHKNVTVEEGQLSNYQDVVLIRDNLTAQDIASPSEELLLHFDNMVTTSDRYVSYDHKASVSFVGSELWMLWLGNKDDQPLRKQGTLERLDVMPAPIVDVQWHKDSRHMIVSSGGSLWFVETDRRGGTNRFYIAPSSKEFYYDRDNNAIYLRDGIKMSVLKLDE